MIPPGLQELQWDPVWSLLSQSHWPGTWAIISVLWASVSLYVRRENWTEWSWAWVMLETLILLFKPVHVVRCSELEEALEFYASLHPPGNERVGLKESWVLYWIQCSVTQSLMKLPPNLYQMGLSHGSFWRNTWWTRASNETCALGPLGHKRRVWHPVSWLLSLIILNEGSQFTTKGRSWEPCTGTAKMGWLSKYPLSIFGTIL